MSAQQFVHLHLHTEYSLLDGAIRIDELMEQAKKYSMSAIAITDHGNLFGVVEFFKKAKKVGIKPIIGCEVYVAPQSRFEKTKTTSGKIEEASFHLTILVESEEGYRNLTKLVTLSYIEGFYYKPRIDIELLDAHSRGLIALSGCLQGEIPYNIVHGNIEKAENTAKKLKDIFGGNFYLEIQSNGLSEQTIANKGLIEISKKFEIPLVATNDCHYLHKSDSRAHDILLCIQTGRTIKDTKRLKFQTDEFYFKSPEEMYSAFIEVPEALKNTLEIAERCNFQFKLGEYKLPQYPVPDEYTAEEYLKRLAQEGLKERFKSSIPHDYMKRLEEELKVITNMGFASYFLIVWDFINYARRKKITVGPGRGSAAGSLVAYALKITDIDPIKYGLLFERFLNPERISMPDIDVDFCKNRREEVIQYVAEKYGIDKVAHIITFGTMAARAVVRDVGRALNIPYSDVDKIAKMIPFACSSLEQALNLEPRLRELYNKSETVRELIDIAMRLEGLVRHSSQHAAGVVISPESLQNLMPLYKNPDEKTVITQFDMKALDDIGVLKFDFLGLKTLTVIEDTIRYVKTREEELRIEDIPLDDAKTYQLLCSGQTTGVFQLESRGMRELLKRMEPRKFEDLIALVALYRPGPLSSGMVDDFIKRKRGVIPVQYELPELKEILDETYGVIVYQEQVMRIANKIAGFTMGQADILRKAMGKKIPELMTSLKEEFIQGAQNNGIAREKAEALFNIMAAFGEYGFNKSHSAAYAYLAYITAYLKAHYPQEFFAANLSNEMGDTNKIVKFINECKAWSIEIKGPDINESERAFTVKGNSIRFGLEAVKGIGGSTLQYILNERTKREFKSMVDFLSRVDTKKVNKKVIESLIKAGAFDSMYPQLTPNQARAIAMHELLSFRDNKSAGGLFLNSQNIESWNNTQLLSEEKSSLGFYLIGHPMKPLRPILNKMNISTIADVFDTAEEEFTETEETQEIKIAGVVEELKIKAKEKGVTAYVMIEDETGRVEVVIYPELFKKCSGFLTEKNTILIKGIIFKSPESIKFLAREIENLENTNLKIKYELSIDCSDYDKAYKTLKEIRQCLEETRNGQVKIYICLNLHDYHVIIQSPFEPCIDFETKIQKIENCQVRIV